MGRGARAWSPSPARQCRGLLCLIPRLQLSFSPRSWEPSLSAPLLPPSPPRPPVHPMPLSLPHFFPLASLLSAPQFLLLCTSFSLSPHLVSPFLTLSAPSHLSISLPPALVPLSRTVWKVEKPSGEVEGGGQLQPLKGWVWLDYYGLSGAIVIRVQAEGGC